MRRILLCVLFSLGVGPSSGAIFEIALEKNDGPSETLFSGKVEVEGGQVSFLGSQLLEESWRMGFDPDQDIVPKFNDHAVVVEEKKLAEDLLTIAKNFEHCEIIAPDLVSGGTFINITCRRGVNRSVETRSYLMTDHFSRAGQVREICRDFQTIVVSDFLTDGKSKKLAMSSIRSGASSLASNISDYAEAFLMLQDSFKDGVALDWEEVNKLARYHKGQPLLKDQSLLTRKGQAILTAACSTRGLANLLGRAEFSQDALILKMEGVRMCQRPGFPDPRSFDDKVVWETFGLVYPPQKPALRVGVLDAGVEMLILHFLCQEDDYATTATDHYSLTIAGSRWKVLRDNSFNHKPYPEGMRERLKFLSNKSGLLTFLVGAGDYPKVDFLDVREIAIKDEEWKVARIDYLLNNQRYVLPVLATEQGWSFHRAWPGNSYNLIDNISKNRDFFRSQEEVQKHDKSR